MEPVFVGCSCFMLFCVVVVRTQEASECVNPGSRNDSKKNAPLERQQQKNVPPQRQQTKKNKCVQGRQQKKSAAAKDRKKTHKKRNDFKKSAPATTAKQKGAPANDSKTKKNKSAPATTAHKKGAPQRQHKKRRHRKDSKKETTANKYALLPGVDVSRSNLSATPLEPAAQDVIDITGSDEPGRELKHMGVSENRGP